MLLFQKAILPGARCKRKLGKASLRSERFHEGPKNEALATFALNKISVCLRLCVVACVWSCALLVCTYVCFRECIFYRAMTPSPATTRWAMLVVTICLAGWWDASFFSIYWFNRNVENIRMILNSYSIITDSFLFEDVPASLKCFFLDVWGKVYTSDFRLRKNCSCSTDHAV